MKVKIRIEERFPNIWTRLTIRTNSREIVIKDVKDGMILWGDFTSFQIQDKVEYREVSLANSKVNYMLTTTVPLMNFLSILDLYAKNVD